VESESTSDSGPDDVSTWMFDNSTYVWIFVFPDLRYPYVCYVGSATSFSDVSFVLYGSVIEKTPVS
jgi:hypothetical protein